MQLGRKPLYLMGLVMITATHVASAVIILAFELEDAANRGNLSMSQTVAGYFVLVLQCLFLGSATFSVGYKTCQTTLISYYQNFLCSIQEYQLGNDQRDVSNPRSR